MAWECSRRFNIKIIFDYNAVFKLPSYETKLKTNTMAVTSGNEQFVTPD
jgi:hypothetical protein